MAVVWGPIVRYITAASADFENWIIIHYTEISWTSIHHNLDCIPSYMASFGLNSIMLVFFWTELHHTNCSWIEFYHALDQKGGSPSLHEISNFGNTVKKIIILRQKCALLG